MYCRGHGLETNRRNEILTLIWKACISSNVYGTWWTDCRFHRGSRKESFEETVGNHIAMCAAQVKLDLG